MPATERNAPTRQADGLAVASHPPQNRTHGAKRPRAGTRGAALQMRLSHCGFKARPKEERLFSAYVHAGSYVKQVPCLK